MLRWNLLALILMDWEFYQNHTFMNRLGATLRPEQVNPNDYAAVYFAGGHGVVWDFPDNAVLQAISARIYDSGGVVSSVCHGAAGLLNIRLADQTLLIAGREVTGFSNDEERLAQLDEHVPFLTEEELKKRGAVYRKADQPFTAFAVARDRLVTGQNPQSGTAVAEKVLALLGQLCANRARGGTNHDHLHAHPRSGQRSRAAGGRHPQPHDLSGRLDQGGGLRLRPGPGAFRTTPPRCPPCCTSSRARQS